jgi:hypothetical protein
MIVVRDIFQIKFGQSKEAMALWREGAGLLKSSGFPVDVRLLTDMVGSPFYTVILESTYKSISDWEKSHGAAKDNAPWKAVYAKIIPLIETGRREILSVVA